MLNLGFFLGFL